MVSTCCFAPCLGGYSALWCFELTNEQMPLLWLNVNYIDLCLSAPDRAAGLVLSCASLSHAEVSSHFFFLQPKGLRYPRNEALECGSFWSSCQKGWLSRVLTRIPGSIIAKPRMQNGFQKTFDSYFAWYASIDTTLFEYVDAEKDAEACDPQAAWVRSESQPLQNLDTDWDGIAIFAFHPCISSQPSVSVHCRTHRAALPLSLF